jgi:transketolase
VGTTLGLRAQGLTSRVVVLTGDAELDEGSNAEAIAFAGAAALGRLTVVVVDNKSATWGWAGGIDRRFAVEGWRTTRVDGRDHAALETALIKSEFDRPDVVVAEVEGKA